MVTDREAQLLRDATQAGITSPRELANLMAQVSEESQGLTHLEEGFRYTQGIAQIPVKYAHREGDDILEQARLDALQGHPEKLAELMYGGRNGNDQPGDGYTYRGRGYIQLTGKANYQEAGTATGLDLVRYPDLATQPENAARIAIWYWQNHVPRADREDVRNATLDINGGYNGLDVRQQLYERWTKVLTPDVVQKFSAGEMPLPVESAANGPHVRQETLTGGPLHQGDRGVAVQALQGNLAQLGYTDPHDHPLKSDGDFGANTKRAVEAFQRDHHLTVDGKVGLHTQVALDQALQTHHAHTALPFTDPRHADHALFAQALAGVHRIDADMGRTPDQQSTNLAAALTVAAKQQGMTRIDEVAISPDGARTSILQIDPVQPKGAQVATVQAVHTPMEQSSVSAIAVPRHTLSEPPMQSGLEESTPRMKPDEPAPHR